MTEDRTTTITVEVPNRLIASVGYSVGCSGSQAKVGMSDVEPELETIAQGLLEPVGVGGSGRVPPTAVWRVLIDLAPASCFVDLEARDSQGEVVCSATEPLRVDRSASTQKYVLLSCEEPLGEARLTIESPATPESDEIGTIAFTATCFGNEDIFLTPEPQFPIVLEGSLELGGEDELDLGSGPVPVQVWHERVREVPPGPCLFEFTALDMDEEPLCQSRRALAINAHAVASLHTLMVCPR